MVKYVRCINNFDAKELTMGEVYKVINVSEKYFEIEHKSWKESLELAGFPSSKGKKIKGDLDKLKQVIESYNYGNRNY